MFRASNFQGNLFFTPLTQAEQRRIASSASMAAYAQVPQQVPYGIPSTQASNIPQPKQQVHAAEVHAGYYHPSAPGPQAAHTPLMGTNGGSTLQTVSTLPTGLSPGEFASDVLPDTQVNVPHTSPPDSVASSPRKSTPTPREGAKTPQDASSGRRQSKDIETGMNLHTRLSDSSKVHYSQILYAISNWKLWNERVLWILKMSSPLVLLITLCPTRASPHLPLQGHLQGDPLREPQHLQGWNVFACSVDAPCISWLRHSLEC